MGERIRVKRHVPDEFYILSPEMTKTLKSKNPRSFWEFLRQFRAFKGMTGTVTRVIDDLGHVNVFLDPHNFAAGEKAFGDVVFDPFSLEREDQERVYQLDKMR